MNCPAVATRPEDVLRAVSEYGPISKKQVSALFPGAETSVNAIISRLQHGGRVVVEADSYVSLITSRERSTDRETAIWVLISFIDNVNYHSTSEYPVQVAFFAKEKAYEVAVVHEGQETLVNHAFWSAKEEFPPRRIVVVDKPYQLRRIAIPNTVAYCTVSPDGDIRYFSNHKNEVKHGKANSDSTHQSTAR